MGPEVTMTRSILLDTDVLVDFFRGHSKAVAFVNAHSAHIILSSIVVAELFAGIHRIGLMPGQQRAQLAHIGTGRVD